MQVYTVCQVLAFAPEKTREQNDAVVDGVAELTQQRPLCRKRDLALYRDLLELFGCKPSPRQTPTPTISPAFFAQSQFPTSRTSTNFLL